MSLPSQDPLAGTAGEYRRFARLEAHGRSAAYEALPWRWQVTGKSWRSWRRCHRASGSRTCCSRRPATCSASRPASAHCAGWWPAAATSWRGRSFVVVRDGTSPLALADPHGAWLRWLEPAQGSG